MANDCSERICQFGLAHVDTPKGDLDASSGALFLPNNAHTRTVIGDQLYPYGTTEMYPDVVDSENDIVTNSAHEYRECSNKGICDRSSGTCSCFPGYDGSACQRASCPSNSNGVCSGHGMCLTVKEIADQYYSGNVYSLWDERSTMGCVCDAGYFGPDCSERKCKFGFDPLYLDTSSTSQTVRYSNWTFTFYNMLQSSKAILTGNYSIVFYDSSGEDWMTAPIGINSKCDAIINALETLPNQVVPTGSVLCNYDTLDYGSGNNYNFDGETNLNGKDGFPAFLPTMTTSQLPNIAAKFTLAFSGNPGLLKQPTINYYLDGARPTLVTNEASSNGISSYASTLGTWIYPNGFIGENYDYFPTLCAGVSLTINAPAGSTVWGTLGGLDVQETKALKRCLGDSNGNPGDNSEVYNWDYGNSNTATKTFTSPYAPGALLSNPHIIKLIDTTVLPSSGLCRYRNSVPTGSPGSAVSSFLPVGFCDVIDPAGFYAVVFFDGTNFNVINRVWEDYSPSTQFNVFTTTGYLTLTSQNVEAFTTSSGLTPVQQASQLYSNILYTTNSSVGTDPYFINNQGFTSGTAPEAYTGAIDCETINANGAGVGSLAGDPSSVSTPGFVAGAYTCLNKGDLVVVLNTRLPSATNPSFIKSNPKYINIYTVDKISRENREFWWHPDSEKWRHQIKFTTSQNANYNLASMGSPKDTAGFVYKFTPPTNAYQYAGECSMRGICDRTAGTCNCFPGYTSDNCGTLNALAQ